MRSISDVVLSDDLDEILLAVRAGEAFEVSIAGRPVGFFSKVSREANELSPDMGKLAPIAAEFGVELLV